MLHCCVGYPDWDITDIMMKSHLVGFFLCWLLQFWSENVALLKSKNLPMNSSSVLT